MSLSSIFFVPGDRGDDDGGDYVIVICGLFFYKKNYWTFIGISSVMVLSCFVLWIMFLLSFLLDRHHNFWF